MFDNVSKCTVGGSGSPLVKAKSSPNVSKVSLSSAKKQNQSNRMANPPIVPVKSTGKSPITSRISIKMTNDTISSARHGSNNSDSSKSRLTSPSKSAKRSPSETRLDSVKTVSSPARGNDKKKVCKSVSSSPSCTILEDRALLKKGLTYTPDKMPGKPEALQRRNILDRSVSLTSVSADNQMNPARWIPIPLERKSLEKGKKAELPRKSLMNRSTSLWSVQTPKVDYNQCRKSYGVPARANSVSRPSKIPLPAARSTGLGRSLADLSQVDRVGEPVSQMISFELDLDTASDERIYENCRESLDRTLKLSRISTSASNLEERAARLMAQLEDDLKPKETILSLDVVDVTPPRRAEIVYEDREILRDNQTNIIVKRCNSADKSKESPRTNEESERKEMMMDIFKDNNVKSEEDSEKGEYVKEEYVEECNRIKNCEKSEEIVEKSRRSKETSIQELRRNWERQSRGNQNSDAKTIYVANSGKTVNLSKTARTGNDVVDDAREAKRKIGKRANDIEHLVNFFNCKNAEASKESSREGLIKPKSPDVSVIETPTVKKNEPKNVNEYSGYTSDGNSSEDSGHISNENEVEWKETMENQSQKETNDFKERQYFDRIDRDSDVKLFDSTIVRRLAEPEKKNIVVNREDRLTSCDDSSIDCLQIDDKRSENERQVRLK